MFRRRFGDRYAMIHRPVSAGSLGAHIWLSVLSNLRHWGDHHVLLHARRGPWWDTDGNLRLLRTSCPRSGADPEDPHPLG